jgi:hypothetical protein
MPMEAGAPRLAPTMHDDDDVSHPGYVPNAKTQIAQLNTRAEMLCVEGWVRSLLTSGFYI